MDTYDLMTIEGLTGFAKDCRNAILECPQGEVWNLFGLHYGIASDRHMKYLAPHTTVSYYMSHRTLWDSGYSAHLSDKAVYTVRRYLMDKSTGAIYDKQRGVYVTRKALFVVVVEGSDEYIIVDEDAKDVYEAYINDDPFMSLM